MKKRIISILLVLFLVLPITGCWDAEEINELGLVLCVALDKTGNQYKVTAQIAKPDSYSKTPSGSGRSEKEKPFWVISSTGETIFEAIRNMAAISPRRIVWAHIKVIIIGEELARSNINDLLDFFTRNPELRLRSLIAATPGEAGKLLEILPMMEKDPATNLEMIIDNDNLTGKGYKNMLKDVLEEYLKPNGNPVISRILLSKSEEDPVLELNGAAYFNKSKMVGWLDGTETRGLLWIKSEIKNSIIVIKCPFDKQPITIELKKEKTSIKCDVENEIPNYTIKVKATGILVEQGCASNFNDPKALEQLKKTLESAIKNDIKTTIQVAQNSRVDFLGLNDVLHSQNKKYWQQLSANWQEVLPQSKFTIDVTANIPSASLLAKPLIPAKAVR